MKQIYHVVEKPRDRWVTDPEQGLVLRHEMVMQSSDVELIEIVHADGRRQVYERHPDGTFMVDDEVGRDQLRKPGWHEGANPFFIDIEEEPPRSARVTRVKAPVRA